MAHVLHVALLKQVMDLKTTEKVSQSMIFEDLLLPYLPNLRVHMLVMNQLFFLGEEPPIGPLTLSELVHRKNNASVDELQLLLMLGCILITGVYLVSGCL